MSSIDSILAVFNKVDVDGEPFYGPQDVSAAIPWLALHAGVIDLAAAPALVPHLTEFATAAGLKPGMSADAVQRAVALHYQRHPLRPELVADLKAVARRLSAELGAFANARVGRVLGEVLARTPMNATPPAPGSVRAGPLARIGLMERIAK